jgi:hypothetical protein
MLRRKLAGERGDGILELVGMLALTAAVIGTAAYVLFLRDDGARTFTPQEQAYLAAVATQQADAYIRAVATQRAAEPPPQQVSAPRQPAAPAPPPQSVVEPPPPPAIPPPAPTSTPAAAPPPPPPPPPAPAPTSPPAVPPPPAKPPMATCVGYMAGITGGGIGACNQITQDTSYNPAVRNCIYAVITGTATSSTGKASCVQASLVTASDGLLSDCFLGLSGQSHYGMTSCRQYYGAH